MNRFERHSRADARGGLAAGQGAAVIPLLSRARSFMVLTTQRTGSSWLMDRLDQSPEIEGHMELFYFDVRREPPRAGCNDYARFVESRGATARGMRPAATFRYLDALYARRTAVGFKLMYSQLRSYPEILPWLVWRRLPLVHLLRQNHLDVVISEALARETGSSHATVKEAAGSETPRVWLCASEAVQRVRRLEAKRRTMRGLLKLLPNESHEVSYEALCSDPRAFEDLCRFLGADPVLVPERSNLIKRQRHSHAQAIDNYEEVRHALHAAGYGHLLRSESGETT